MTRPEDIIKLVENSLSDNTVGKVMTLADRLRQEGRQEGAQKGREIAMQETLTLADKFKKEGYTESVQNLV